MGSIRLAGHGYRHRELLASRLVWCEPSPAMDASHQDVPTKTLVDIVKMDEDVQNSR